MNILILGGGGFVGKNLIRVMKEGGINLENITVIDKDKEGLSYVKQQGAKVILADLAVKENLWEGAFENQDIIISLHAQISSPEEEPFLRNNVLATKNIVEAAKTAGVSKIIHFSSAAVLSVRKDDYAKTKQEGEEIIKSSGLKYIILQPSIMYGIFDNKNIGWLIQFARKIPFFPIPGNGQYPRQPIYIDDICGLVIKLINNFPSENKVYGINGKDIVYFKEMVKAVLKELRRAGRRCFPVYIPIPIFIFLVRIYDKLFGSPFTVDQIKSLVSGDIFPVYPWWEEFNIHITSFEKGVETIMRHK